MRTVKLILYYVLAAKLPSSWWPGGVLFNRFRLWCLRGIMEVGHGTRVQKGVYVGKGRDVTIGSNCQINEGARLDNVAIGNNVMIARETVVLGLMHEVSDVSVPMVDQGNKEVAQTTIENDVWLGLRTTVMPGLTIAEGTILGAGSVLTKNTEPYGIYGGVPARLIRTRGN